MLFQADDANVGPEHLRAGFFSCVAGVWMYAPNWVGTCRLHIYTHMYIHILRAQNGETRQTLKLRIDEGGAIYRGRGPRIHKLLAKNLGWNQFDFGLFVVRFPYKTLRERTPTHGTFLRVNPVREKIEKRGDQNATF